MRDWHGEALLDLIAAREFQLRLADRIYAAHEVLANLAERRTRPVATDDPARLAALAVLSAAGADVTRCDLARAADEVRRELAAAELRGRAAQATGGAAGASGPRQPGTS